MSLAPKNRGVVEVKSDQERVKKKEVKIVPQHAFFRSSRSDSTYVE